MLTQVRSHNSGSAANQPTVDQTNLANVPMAVKKAGGTLKGRFVCWLNTTYDGHLTKGLAGFAGAMFGLVSAVCSLVAGSSCLIFGLKALSTGTQFIPGLAFIGASYILLSSIRCGVEIIEICGEYSKKHLTICLQWNAVQTVQ